MFRSLLVLGFVMMLLGYGLIFGHLDRSGLWTALSEISVLCEEKKMRDGERSADR